MRFGLCSKRKWIFKNDIFEVVVKMLHDQDVNLTQEGKDSRFDVVSACPPTRPDSADPLPVDQQEEVEGLQDPRLHRRQDQQD